MWEVMEKFIPQNIRSDDILELKSVLWGQNLFKIAQGIKWILRKLCLWEGRLFIPLKLQERVGNVLARKYRTDTLHYTNTFIASNKYCDYGVESTEVKLGETLRKYFPLFHLQLRTESRQ